MSRAAYNEIDPKAAAWLRELIKKGLIAPGDVIEASIEDLTPNDLKPYTQVHFFAGIGVWSYALRRAGVSDDTPCWTMSCPCQPFSAAGKGAGFDDERHLWPSAQWLIQQCQPELIFGEQVASKDAEPWLDLVQTDVEALGYAFGACAFPSAGVGAPHIRDRTYWVADANTRRRQPQSNASPAGVQSGLDAAPTARFKPSDDSASAGGLADDDAARLEGRGQPGRERGNELAAGPRGLAGGLAKSDGARHVPGTLGGIHSGEGGAGSRHGEPERSGADGRVADASIFGRIGRRAGEEGDAPGSVERPDGLRDAGGLGGHAGAHGAGAQREHGLREVATHAGPVNGGWADADWIYCRNGEWRPVEPGTFPLAHGAPARVGRLRGFGNAINAEAAALFIEAYLEAEADGGLSMTSASGLSHELGVFA